MNLTETSHQINMASEVLFRARTGLKAIWMLGVLTCF